MRKLFLRLLIVLLLTSSALAADVPITTFPDNPTPTVDDLLYCVNDPGGTPASNKCTIGNVFNTLKGLLTIPVSKWFDVAGCDNATAGLILDTPTSNPPTPECDTGSNTQKAVAKFDDTTDQYIPFKFRLPTTSVSGGAYDPSGGINVVFRWKSIAITGSTGWCLQLARVPVGATSDPPYAAQASGNCVSDTANGTTLQENEATKTTVTCSSCVAGDMIYGLVSRDANGSAVTDSMTGNALLLGFEISYRRFIQ